MPRAEPVGPILQLLLLDERTAFAAVILHIYDAATEHNLSHPVAAAPTGVWG